MKASKGGDFHKALKNTFVPELISMNYLMAAMMIVYSRGHKKISGCENPLNPEFLVSYVNGAALPVYCSLSHQLVACKHSVEARYDNLPTGIFFRYRG